MTESEALLRVEQLRVSFPGASGRAHAVDDISFSVAQGRVLCIVGESGSGKSLTARAMLGLVAAPATVAGRVIYQNQNLLSLPPRRMAALRGDRLSMVFQNPMTALNPVFTVGEQVAEGIRRHQGLGRQAARKAATDLLALVGIPDAARRYDEYPHRFSGGMRQRILIAAAVACRPDVLIADEPTTALDVSVQAHVLRLFKTLQAEMLRGLIIITHDIGVVAAIADDVLVMRHGRVAEYGAVHAIFASPQHAYTRSLIEAASGRTPNAVTAA